MLLTKQNASQIVTEINSVLDQKINIMDHRGIILASSNPERIGSCHMAARKLIKENLTELLIERDELYAGSKKGINFPITVKGKIAGVIGISGDYEKIKKYGEIIKKMTEILLLDSLQQEQNNITENLRNHFAGEWMSSDADMINMDFINRGLSLGIDIRLPRRILMVLAKGKEERKTLENLQAMERAQQSIHTFIMESMPQSIVYKSGFVLICAVAQQPDADIKILAGHLKDFIEDRYPVSLTIGIDSFGGSYLFTLASCKNAKKALLSHTGSKKPGIRFYSDMNLELFLDEISEVTKVEYVQNLFQKGNACEMKESLHILEVLYREDGSITRTAELLHLHKNTLQYRLKKIQKQCGYDPRSLKSAYLYQIAICFHEEVQQLIAEAHK